MRLCPLCGLRFSEAEAKRPCRGCPLGNSCDLICCPNCGYQTPEEPRWLMRWRRWRQTPESPPFVASSETMTLAALEPGRIAQILEVRPQDDAVLRKLTALGLLPGVRLQLLRSFPCYLVRIGHAQIALDRQLASAILVGADVHHSLARALLRR